MVSHRRSRQVRLAVAENVFELGLAWPLRTPVNSLSLCLARSVVSGQREAARVQARQRHTTVLSAEGRLA